MLINFIKKKLKSKIKMLFLKSNKTTRENLIKKQLMQVLMCVFIKRYDEKKNV